MSLVIQQYKENIALEHEKIQNILKETATNEDKIIFSKFGGKYSSNILFYLWLSLPCDELAQILQM